MHTTSMLGALCALLVTAMLALAIGTRRKAESARAIGYDQGYEDAKASASSRIEELSHTLSIKKNQVRQLQAEHRLELDAVMQDCDLRIAVFARRTLSSDDITTLKIINKQLAVAAATYKPLKLTEEMRHLANASARLEALVNRANEATDATPAEPPLRSILRYKDSLCLASQPDKQEAPE